MDIGKLKEFCIIECHKGYNYFKHCIHSNPFDELNEGYIEDSINLMIEKINPIKHIINTSGNLSYVQLNIIKDTVSYYKNITIKYARLYGEKHLSRYPFIY